MRIKQAITGRGSASKQQVASIINSILSTDYQPRRLDATDGMAVAPCHWFTTSNVLTRATAGEKRKGLGGWRQQGAQGQLIVGGFHKVQPRQSEAIDQHKRQATE